MEPRNKQEGLLGNILAIAEKKLDKSRYTQMAPFLRALYEPIPEEDLHPEDPENLFANALSLWDFFQKREEHKAKVRVFNPDRKKHGWAHSSTIVEIVNDDMPFLVDSVTAEINLQEMSVQLVLHPIFHVMRDHEGRFLELNNASGHAESVMQLRISAIADESKLQRLKERLEIVLKDVRVAVGDWPQMRSRLKEAIQDIVKKTPPVATEEITEAVDFLRWIDDDHFTYLGYREYLFENNAGKLGYKIRPDAGLGLLRDNSIHVFDGLSLDSIPPHVLNFLQQPTLLMVAKANLRSTVHRNAYLDTFGIKIFDETGKVIGERLFAGLFTSGAYNRSPWDIPLLRRKVEQVTKAAGFAPASHNAKTLNHILETFPRDELFQSSENDLLRASMGILHLQERQRIALFARKDPFDRFFSCLVYMPRDRVSSKLNKQIGQLLSKAFNGRVSSMTPHYSEGLLVRLHYIIATQQGQIPSYDIAAIEDQIIEASRSWHDRLTSALKDSKGESIALQMASMYGEAFPLGYEEDFSPALAVLDLDFLQEALTSGKLGINLYRPMEAQPHEVYLKLYQRDGKIALSDILPSLENFGMKVINENAYKINPSGSPHHIWLHDFTMVSADSQAIDLGNLGGKFHQALSGVWAGELEDDGFNRLVFSAGLDRRDISLLRAYCKYLRQVGITFSQSYMEQTLNNYPSITKQIVDLFYILLDPSYDGSREAKALEASKAILKALDKVANLDEDRILRRYINCIQSTLRTNFFQLQANGLQKEYISFKLDSQAIEELPLPRPMVEVFVYSPRAEAIHLRGAKVARGGIRWSDRREDFRTEILGLMKAQMVKNSVIVPVGSKGGFVVKRPPQGADRDTMMAEVIYCYKILMRGLLDITDNLINGKVVPPSQVVRRDNDDPYLVVAADKGTATFSDIANSVSREYGFWLDDAFASGGSAGYDHKKMGITAKGAWVCVQRHFREMGMNTQSQDFTAVGVGDMSGDVFGNGMLRSEHIGLLGAFNHQHIFIDPSPDRKKSFMERKRLFELPRSSWADYDVKVISKGGGIFERKAKAIDLSPEAQKMLGIEKTQATPNEVIRAMLKMPVDLLWFGGIGTYVKAMSETNADAGDRANDAIRVNGMDLKCKVVGEGANLGFTQKGRIEASLHGIKMNTDAVDNSAGVDCSDHEVNIKILVNDVVTRGDLSMVQRDKLLAEMTDEVGDLVLRDNYLQSQALSVAEAQSFTLLDQQNRFMRALEKQSRLDRAIEFLPDDETIQHRLAQRVGLTRPENAVLLAYAKMALYDELLPSDLPDDPQLIDDLVHYFPAPLRQSFRKQIEGHRLRREIIATAATNSLVNRAGATFAHILKEKTSAEAPAITRAFVIARGAFRLRDLWSGIEALDNLVPSKLQTEMLLEINRILELATIWFLRHGTHPLDIARNIENVAKGIMALEHALPHLLSVGDQSKVQSRYEGLSSQGVQGVLADRMARLPYLSNALDIVTLAGETGHKVEEAGQTYFAVGDQFNLDWLRQWARSLIGDSHWQRLAVFAIIEDLYTHQRDLTSAILKNASGVTGQAAIEMWRQNRGAPLTRAEQLFADLRQVAKVELSMLAVANRTLRSLVG